MDEVEFHAPPRESKSKRWLSFHPFPGWVLLQLEARPRWPLQFDCPDCLSSPDFSSTLRASLESSVSCTPTMSDQVDPCPHSKGPLCTRPLLFVVGEMG